MIEVRNLTKRYGPVLAVDDITFDVERGGIVGFLGPNGAGKSTTMKILTCYMPPTGGTAKVAGCDVFTNSIGARRHIGYLPENTPLYPEMRVREYLHFRGKLRAMDRMERNDAIRRVTERCWLGQFIDRPIGQLSKGMRQRVGLADAIMHDPELLILDEPTIGLDPNQIRETRSLIRELGERHTVLLSSHILHEVEQVCVRTVIISAGRIVASGSPKELREQFSANARVIAELKGPPTEVEKGVRALEGVEGCETSSSNGWVRLAVSTKPNFDIRENLYRLSASKDWSLREIRLEGATLEDYFVKVTAEHASRRPGVRSA